MGLVPVGDRFIQELGVVDHITKPFSPEVLLAVTEHTLERARGDRGLPWRAVRTTGRDLA